ncbi:MAG: tRNA (adenosine(37)-N6)-threonylcarbamoyltransferase complex dimerization subunit type 1 TsaB [Chloroflexi bacterium]|nr:tRNA (adenosine(37)-N6)-threonylcarbamoyltransferase complex dimerization subunit type 1 TsaB [Chloroflexota bacterium]
MIIAIDGASTDQSVALAAPDGELVAEDTWTSARRQSAELLPRILALLGDRSLHDTTLVAVGTGPGSFTGLRVAMALAKGLSFGLRVPIIGVPSLGAWLDAEPDAAAAVGRAGARDAYLLGRGDATPRIADRDALSGLGIVVAAGDLAAAFGLADARRPRGARSIARRAAERMRADPAGDDLRTLEPVYLRAPRGVEAESIEPVRWL